MHMASRPVSILKRALPPHLLVRDLGKLVNHVHGLVVYCALTSQRGRWFKYWDVPKKRELDDHLRHLQLLFQRGWGTSKFLSLSSRGAGIQDEPDSVNQMTIKAPLSWKVAQKITPSTWYRDKNPG
jgi:hypothetical protein